MAQQTHTMENNNKKEVSLLIAKCSLRIVRTGGNVLFCRCRFAYERADFPDPNLIKNEIFPNLPMH